MPLLFVCFLNLFQWVLLVVASWFWVPEKGETSCTQVPLYYPGRRVPSHFFAGNVPSAWRSSQTETQDVGPRDLCTLGTTGTHRHHPFCSLMSHGGPSPGSSAGSFRPGSGLGSSCPKGSLFLILVLMTSDTVLPPKDTPEPQELHGTLCKDPRPQFLIRNIFKYLWQRWEKDFQWTIIWIHV